LPELTALEGARFELKLTPLDEIPSEKLTPAQGIKKLPHFMKFKCSLPY
jgi:hypothetical protein